MKHTPTPWSIEKEDHDKLHICNTPDLYVIATIYSDPIDDKAQADAYRIRDCVNALAGIENPEEWRLSICKEVKELREAGNALIEAMNQYSFFANGYRNGSASISEFLKASEDQHAAYSNMFDVLKKQLLNKQP